MKKPFFLFRPRKDLAKLFAAFALTAAAVCFAAALASSASPAFASGEGGGISGVFELISSVCR